MLRAHLAWPVRFSPTGGFVMAEQDSPEDIGGCIATGLLWPLGTRDLDVEFGNLNPLGTAGTDLDAARRAAAYADERAGDLGILEDPAKLAEFVSSVQVGFTGPQDES